MGRTRKSVPFKQRNARSTYAELGALVGLKPPAVHDRVKRLESRGFVTRYAAQLDARRVGYELTAFVSAYCTSDLDYDAFTLAVQAFPEIIEIHSVAGDETYLLKVVTRSTANPIGRTVAHPYSLGTRHDGVCTCCSAPRRRWSVDPEFCCRRRG